MCRSVVTYECTSGCYFRVTTITSYTDYSIYCTTRMSVKITQEEYEKGIQEQSKV